MSQTLQRFILINVIPPFLTKEEGEKKLQELISLVDTYGGATIVKVIQRRQHPDNHTYIGSGKADEVTEIVGKEKIDVVVLNDVVKPGQMFNLEKLFWKQNPRIQVWDRVDLILQIFSKHAHTAEAKLQIDLARMRHMGPRIYGMGMVMSRQGGGIGTRGLGETNTELMKRHWRNEMKRTQEKLEKLSTDREKQLEHRKEIDLKTVSLIGYTNAGKTTLFNNLTGKNKLAENVLFATLDSHVGKLYLPDLKKQILISDTIGFIRNLPTELIEAFKSTLMASIHADLLLHVIDISDQDLYEKIAVVEKVLKELGIDQKERVYIFNKTDLPHTLDEKTIAKKFSHYDCLSVSSRNSQAKQAIVKLLETKLGAYQSSDHSVHRQQDELNFTYSSIMQYLKQYEESSFPHNLGLLFLIGNYLSFYFTRLVINGLNKEEKFEQAHKFTYNSEQKYTLGQLFGKAKKYIPHEELIPKLKKIIEERNHLTHELLKSTNNMQMIKEEANISVSNIYTLFDEISSQISP